MYRIRIVVSLFLLCYSLASAQYLAEEGYYVSDGMRNSAEHFYKILHPGEVVENCGVVGPYGMLYGSFSHPEAFEAIYVSVYGNFSTTWYNQLFRWMDEAWLPLEASVSRGRCTVQNTLEHKDILICLEDDTENLWNSHYWDEQRSIMQLSVNRFTGDTSSTETLFSRENLRMYYPYSDDPLAECDVTQPYHSYYDTPRLSTKDNNMDGFPDLVLTVRHHLITECYNNSDAFHEISQGEREIFQGEWVDYEMVWLFDGLGYTPTEETLSVLEHIESFAATEGPNIVYRSSK